MIIKNSIHVIQYNVLENLTYMYVHFLAIQAKYTYGNRTRMHAQNTLE